MPTPFDLLSSELEEEDPEDLLRNMIGQDQGKNLVGGPEAKPDGKVSPPPRGAQGMRQPVAASPNVPGPLAALARILPKKKPHIRLKNKSPPPKVKKIKPHIKLKASAYGRSL